MATAPATVEIELAYYECYYDFVLPVCAHADTAFAQNAIGSLYTQMKDNAVCLLML